MRIVTLLTLFIVSARAFGGESTTSFVPARGGKPSCALAIGRLSASLSDLRDLLRFVRKTPGDTLALRAIADEIESKLPESSATRARARVLRHGAELSEIHARYGAKRFEDLPWPARARATELHNALAHDFAEYGAGWIPESKVVSGFGFENGLLRHASVDVEALLRETGGDRGAIGRIYAGLRAHGITKLTFHRFTRAHHDDRMSVAHTLLDSPAMLGFSEVKVFTHQDSMSELSPRAAADLAAIPHLRNLERLDLDIHGIGRQGVEAIARSPHLRNLRTVGDLESMLRREEDPLAVARDWVTNRGFPFRFRYDAFRHLVQQGARDFPLRADTIRKNFPNEAEAARVLEALVADARFTRRFWEEPLAHTASLFSMAGENHPLRDRIVTRFLDYHALPTKLVADLEGPLTTVRRDISAEGIFAKAVLAAKPASGPGVAALAEILARAKPGVPWPAARDAWLAASHDPIRKAQYLLAHLQEPWSEKRWDAAVENELARHSSYPTFFAAAKDEAARSALRRADPRSFELAQITALGAPRAGAHLKTEGEVRSKSPFTVGRTSLTRLQRAILDGGATPGDPDCDLPVANISAEDAVRLLEKWNALERLKPAGRPRFVWKLPTREDAERAAQGELRVARAFRFAYPLSRLGEYANFVHDDHSPVGLTSVARKKPNAFGLFDVFGNVAEWTSDELNVPGFYRYATGQGYQSPRVTEAHRGIAYPAGQPDVGLRAYGFPSE